MPIAQAGRSVSTPPALAQAGGVGSGLIRLVTPSELDQRDRAELDRRAATGRRAVEVPDIGHWIRQQWMVFRNHRNLGTNPLSQRLLRAQRTFECKYDSEKLSQITAFGGSEVYAGITPSKCRGATSLLRDVYLGSDRPWAIETVPDPPIPPDVRANILQLVSTEVGTLQQAGSPISQDQVHMRYIGLLHSAQQAARRNAQTQADAAADKIDDILSAGGFYEALGEFLLDLPMFPYAVLKGPVVRMMQRLNWIGNKPQLVAKPTMTWERVNPFNIYWSPGASRIEDGPIIERKRYTRADLNDLIGLPGYNELAVRAALEDYALGLREWLDSADPEQAINEGREDPSLNRSHYIEGIEYHGNIQGRMLLDQGIDKKLIPDLDRDYMVQSWVVGRHTLKTTINPSPRQRPPYFLTSFEKIPGTVAGHSLTDILEDIQEVTNATFRSLVNNLSISSGPQVVINDEMVSPTEASDQLYPWKRWHVQGDPLGNQRDPISFFQPHSNAMELLQVINAMGTMADERSAIPKYTTGESLSGGAGRTASGLSMLMNNAEKVLQTVCANIDVDVLQPLLETVYDMIMLTDTTGILTGQEQIKVMGSSAKLMKDTQHTKQLQFLQITGNPIDAQIIGEVGRARVLRSIASDLGLPDDVVPDDQTLQAQLDAQKRMQAAGQALLAHAQGQGAAPPGANQVQHPGHPAQNPQGGQAGTPPKQGGGMNIGQAAQQAQGQQAPAAQPPGAAAIAPPVNQVAAGPPSPGGP